jgi:hypothetical protein
LLALTMVWAYFSYSQFLIIWSGNLPEEIPWYLTRLRNGWQYVAVLLVVGHFALPFALLLSSDLKRRAESLAAVAGLVIVMRLIDLFWLVAPEFRRHGLTIDWFDPVTVVGLCGVWLALFIRELKARPMLPLRDPHLADAIGEGEQYAIDHVR